MKRYFGTTVVVCVILLVGVFFDFSMAEQGRKYVGSYEAATRPIVKNLTAATTNYEILDDMNGTSKSWVVDKIILAGAVAARVYFNDTGTTGDIGYGPYRIPTAGGTVIDDTIYLQLVTAAGLYVSSSAAVEVTVERHIK